MRIVMLPHGLLFSPTGLVFQGAHIIKGTTVQGWKFHIKGKVEHLELEKEFSIHREAAPQDLVRVPSHVKGAPKDVIRWARRKHRQIYSQLAQ